MLIPTRLESGCQTSVIAEHSGTGQLGQQLWLLECWNTVKTGVLALTLLFEITVTSYQFTEDSNKRKELQQHNLYIRSTLESSELL